MSDIILVVAIIACAAGVLIGHSFTNSEFKDCLAEVSPAILEKHTANTIEGARKFCKTYLDESWWVQTEKTVKD